MLVTLLVWTHAQGVTSSRRIEAACNTDVAFRVICAGSAPDHVTVARFRAGFRGSVESLFGEVLVLCARLGMGKLGTVTLDGTKIAANASKAANRGEEALQKLAAGRVERGSVHPNQHVVGPDFGQVGVGQVQNVRRAEPVLDDHLHRVIPPALTPHREPVSYSWEAGVQMLCAGAFARHTSPPFCSAAFACRSAVSAAPNKLICAVVDLQRCARRSSAS